MAFVAWVAVAALPSFGCSKPQPPQITVKDLKVTDVDFGGLTVTVNAEAYNPNAIPLTIQHVSGSARLEGMYELGSATVSTPMNLPAGARTAVSVPLAMKWQKLTTMAVVASGAESIPYTLTGTMAVGGEQLSIELPFQVQGTVTRKQLLQAATVPAIPDDSSHFPPAAPAR